MIHGICRKRAWALRHGKKVSQMDERYLKRAEDQLYGELPRRWICRGIR